MLKDKEMQVIFAENLKYYLILNNKSDIDLAHDLIIPRKSIHNWLNGIFLPQYQTLNQLAAYFHINITDLLTKDTKNHNSVNPLFQEILNQVPLLSKTELTILVNVIKSSL